MNQRINLDSYIEILNTLRCSKTIKQLGKNVNLRATALYKTIYYLEDKGLIQKNGTAFVQSKKNKVNLRRARLYITTDKGHKFLAVLEN